MKRKNNEDEVVPTNMPKNIRKYWYRRYEMFRRFDEGIKLSNEMWFSVTPEAVALYISNQIKLRLPNAKVVLDSFGGAGGNTIQFVYDFDKVHYMDINKENVELARHNAGVYGVRDYINFMEGDFFNLESQHLNAFESDPVDVVFLSPPWGGPTYNTQAVWTLKSCEPYPIQDVVKAALKICSNLVLYLPRNSNLDEIVDLIPKSVSHKSVLQYLCQDGHCAAVVVYIGPDFVTRQNPDMLSVEEEEQEEQD